MSKLSTQPYKGTRDFYPEGFRVRQYMFDTWRRVALKYGYEEYDAPTLEPTELYRAKTGEEIVNDQLYTFNDRGDREVSIRPEMTPTVSRMIAGRRQELAYPARWFSIANFMRYERPQRGRLREFWQINADLFGVGTIDGELEMIMFVSDVMKAFGAEKNMYKIRINSRKLVVLLMADYLELDPVQANRMTRLLDRKDKLPETTFTEEAEAIFAEEDRIKGVERLQKVLQAKSMADLPESLLKSGPVKEIQILFTLLGENNITNAVFDVSLMRGLDYYTDIVFEVFDTHPENNRSMFGGGRYDGLVGLFGVEPLPTLGFAIGDITFQNFLESHNLLPQLRSETDIYIVVVGDMLRQAQGVAAILREDGLNVAVDITGRKPDKQIKTADKKRIPHVLFVGEEELESEQFTLKTLATGEEEKMSLARIAATLQDYRRPTADMLE